MIISTDAVVLRTMKYRDSSRIATLYTRSSGKMSVIAKGARERASRFGDPLDVLGYVAALVYYKEHRDLQLLARCDVRRPFRRLSEDMERMAAALAVVELLNAVTHDEEENPPLFELLVGTLEAIDTAARNVASPRLFFELHLLTALGFRPNLTTCFQCGLPLWGLPVSGLPVSGTPLPAPAGGSEGPATFTLNPAAGGVYCADCTARGMGFESVSAGTVRSLQLLQGLDDPRDAARIAMSPQIRAEVAATLRRFLQSHVEGLRPSKSEAVFASLLQP
ncbi:MAG TPA: DNA repair protein RecO [Bacteroidota bacterium]